MFRRLFVMMLLGLLALPPQAQAAQDIYGPIGRSDTLWRIAEKLSPTKEAATQQVILAIYNKNKHAFTVNNINSLRKDAYMLAPTKAEVLAVSKKSAIRMVQRHNTRWKKGRYVPIHDPVPAELTKKLAKSTKTEKEPTKEKTDVTTKPVTDSKTTAPPVAQTLPQPIPDTITEGMPVQEQLRIVKQELQTARNENQLLKNELIEAREQQKQNLAKHQKADPNIQVQLDALSHELKELRTILVQKDNHIQTLQASLKSASEAIKSQHADNMRLYDKLKELSPESIPAQAKQEPAKPHIKLAAVTTPKPATDNKVIPKETADSKIWADEKNTGAMNPVNTTSKPANDVKNSSAVSLSQLINGQQVGLTKSSTASDSRAYSVSPIAWAAVLLSLIFILFLVIRAFIMQNEIRQFEKEDR
uniref:FimV N-terminal domain-containing protein n=1 Tax=uncultured Thiotrichaceae bacterium TaxID=298394 RepID=A0A6S6UB33_9GAMM|nr:MAG: Unknown protein [uncultured Thiotrichaceae bacterium]